MKEALLLSSMALTAAAMAGLVYVYKTAYVESDFGLEPNTWPGETKKQAWQFDYEARS